LSPANAHSRSSCTPAARSTRDITSNFYPAAIGAIIPDLNFDNWPEKPRTLDSGTARYLLLPLVSKAMRAEPISLLYEKGRVLHRHGLDQLEGEMMAFSREWDRAVDGSPNRLDAMIWGITRLSKIITHIPIA